MGTQKVRLPMHFRIEVRLLGPLLQDSNVQVFCELQWRVAYLKKHAVQIAMELRIQNNPRSNHSQGEL